MVMDKEQFTFDEIVEELQISKSSASNALKNLEIREDIEYITQPGDRKRYFQVRKQDKFTLIKGFEKKMSQSMDMFDCILSLKADKNSSNAVFLKEMKDTMEFVLTQLNKLIEESENK
jgi:DNA-binding transcriptional regulator GbsR (MarR family)